MFTLQSPALAADIGHGRQVFNTNCAACHMGGRNTIMPQKTLKKAALKQYLKNFNEQGVDAIIDQATNGQGAMPAFKGRLKPNDIEDVAAYVLAQAEKGW